MRLRAWFAALALVVSGALIAAPANAAASAAACTRSLSGSSAPIEGQAASARPVVLVHGWTGAPMTGTATALKQKLGSAINTFTFDYSTWSSDWASNANIAPCLASYVHSVSDAYAKVGGDGRVILVAHSMGGIAIRYASSSAYVVNPITAAQAPLVVTLDTPYLGSPWSGSQITPDLKEALGAVFQGRSTPNPFGTDGGACLHEHQQTTPLPSQCQGLPPYLADGTTLDELAGDITVDRTFLGVDLYSVNLNSDGIVTTTSSTGYRDSGPDNVAPVVSGNQGTTVHAQPVPCTVTTGQLKSFANTVGGVLTSLVNPITDATDAEAFRELNGGHFLPVVAAYDVAALGAASCSHINIPVSADAISQVATDITTYLQAHPTTGSGAGHQYSAQITGFTPAADRTGTWHQESWDKKSTADDSSTVGIATYADNELTIPYTVHHSGDAGLSGVTRGTSSACVEVQASGVTFAEVPMAASPPVIGGPWPYPDNYSGSITVAAFIPGIYTLVWSCADVASWSPEPVPVGTLAGTSIADPVHDEMYANWIWYVMSVDYTSSTTTVSVAAISGNGVVTPEAGDTWYLYQWSSPDAPSNLVATATAKVAKTKGQSNTLFGEAGQIYYLTVTFPVATHGLHFYDDEGEFFSEWVQLP
jgi:pimeloyl-ACP methyl ester carboxylesterase